MRCRPGEPMVTIKPMNRTTTKGGLLALATILVAAAALFISQGQASTDKPLPAIPGAPFPKVEGLMAVNTVPGPQASTLADFSLDSAMQGKYLLLFYWIAGEETAEESLVSLAQWAKGKPKVSLVGIVPPRGKSAQQVVQRCQELGLEIPVIWDEGYRMQQTVRAASVPHISVVDPNRVVRMLGAYNLKHKVLDDITLGRYLDTAVGGGGHPTIAEVPRHYPVTELIDGPYIDFTLNKVPDNQVVRLSDLVTDGKLTLLVFWSPDCGHCKIELPELDKYYQRHRDALNLVGIVKVPNDGVRQRTSDFIRLHDLKWPTVVDRAQKVYSDYRVRTTPTTVVVSPQGKVQSVLLGSGVNLDDELGPLIADLKKTARSGA